MSGWWSSPRVCWGACFAAPIIGALVLVAAHDTPSAELDDEPAIDAELVAQDMRLPRVERRESLSPEQTAAYRAAAARLEEDGVALSPFASNERYEHEPEVDFQNPGVESPALKLTSVMSASDGAICVINHTVRRVGDRVGDEWSVSRIDVAQRSVTLKADDGRSLVLAQR